MTQSLESEILKKIRDQLYERNKNRIAAGKPIEKKEIKLVLSFVRLDKSMCDRIINELISHGLAKKANAYAIFLNGL